MHQHRLSLSAPTQQALHLWIEPWAEGVAFPPGSTVELVASSEHPGQLELEESAEATAVYAWPGSTLKVLLAGQVVASFDTPVPGGLTKANVTMLFGLPPTPTPEEKSASRKSLDGLPPNTSLERTRDR